MIRMAHEFEALTVPGPTVTEESRPFWEAAAGGKLMIQQCEQCDRWVFYPRSHCPGCWSDRLAWREASGMAKLKSYSVVHRAGHPAWQSLAPYALALVQLDEGPSMLTTLVDMRFEALEIGMPLQVRYVRVGEFTLPMFTAAQAYAALFIA
ncbi:hypothetical protein Tamer19_36900 [Cupriavidus sp. TA19]|uniref:Zn-ribbon domain-containing OB-fold protein n=1 Tax=Cupriavidus sp. TA19 TaxID=701108 RepID=UPI002729482D|nr:OB-fold domain-containing protein [Cupriavidus sp. TA19]GLC94282.1 hypothetical protein Tamer19_36900 [Cupriavidus sp. TA19]